MTLPENIAFVDVETTGMRFLRDRIIEIGILRIEKNKLIDTYTTLINPGLRIPPEILAFTGISPSDLDKAPTFQQVADDIAQLLSGCTFAAHNVQFDYSFVRNEFKRLERHFQARYFCTVKLSRSLFPRFKSHNLDSIIERFSIPCPRRHRALDDATVLWKFYQHVQKSLPKKTVLKSFEKVTKQPSLPTNLETNVQAIPESPGVYIFYASDNTPLYVGKSKNIRQRVFSHFSSSERFILKMQTSVARIETIKTAGEVGALLKESQLIKTLQPLYNRTLRNRKKLVVLSQTQDKNGYYSVAIEATDAISKSDTAIILSVCKTAREAKRILANLAEEYGLCEKLLSLEHTTTSCFAYRLEKCIGACVGQERPISYNMRFIQAFAKTRIRRWPFKNPILIEEVHPLNNTRDFFVVDNWCLVATGSIDENGFYSGKSYELTFDKDYYQVFLKTLLYKRHTLRITQLTDRYSLDSVLSQFCQNSLATFS